MKLHLVLAAACLLGGGSVASAQEPCFGGFGGFGGYNHYGLEHIPYFSRFPPVYYSYPVPRTYGYSPFAYPPGVMTPEVHVEFVQPQTMHNPYVPRQDKPVRQDEQTARAPLRIANPFVNVSGPAVAADSR